MRAVIELDKNLTEGELLIYKDGVIKSVNIRELLKQELKNIVKNSEDIQDLKKISQDLDKKVKELRGED